MITQLRPHLTILLHRPTGKRFIVDQVQPAGVTLSGLLGGARRLARPEDIANAEVWRVEYA